MSIFALGLMTWCANAQGDIVNLSVAIKYDSVQSLDGKYFAVKSNGKWGVVKDNKQILACEYDYIDALGDDVITFVQNGKAGFADVEGRILAAASYPLELETYTEDKTQLNLFDNGSCVVVENGRLKLINKENQVLLGDSLEIISRIGEAVIVKKNALYGMCNSKGEMTVEAQYQALETLVAGELYAYQIYGNDGIPVYGLLNAEGKYKSKPQFADFLTFKTKKNIFIKAYTTGGSQALFSEKGDLLVQPLYQVIEPTNYPNYFNISENTKKGILGANYVLYVEPKYDEVRILVKNDTFFVATSGLTSYVLNTKNQILVEFEGVILDLIQDNQGGLSLLVEQDLSYGLYGSNGKWLIEPQYDEVMGIVGNNLCVRKGKKWGAVDFKNNIIVDFLYEKARLSDTEELIAFYSYKKGSKLLCDNGRITDFPKCESVLAFGNYIEYKVDKKKERLYSSGKKIPANFLSIGSDKDGIICAKTEKGWSYFDSETFKPLTEKTFDALGSFVKGIAFAAKDNTLLVLDKSYNALQTLELPKNVNISSIIPVLTVFRNAGKDYCTITDASTGKTGVITINK